MTQLRSAPVNVGLIKRCIEIGGNAQVMKHEYLVDVGSVFTGATFRPGHQLTNDDVF